jgi:hypothetical protein
MRICWGSTPLIATPLMGLPAWGDACVKGSVDSYEALGATGCTVGPLTFSDIVFQGTNVTGLEAIAPYSQDGEFGLQLSFDAVAFITVENGNPVPTMQISRGHSESLERVFPTPLRSFWAP